MNLPSNGQLIWNKENNYSISTSATKKLVEMFAQFQAIFCFSITLPHLLIKLDELSMVVCINIH